MWKNSYIMYSCIVLYLLYVVEKRLKPFEIKGIGRFIFVHDRILTAVISRGFFIIAL